jgi:adenylylsulfate kinase
MNGSMPPVEKPLTFWLTGLSGSGKTTLANALAEALALMALPSQLVDGDTLRQQQSAGLGYSRDHRRANVLRATELCRSINNSGEIAIAALISPFRADRELARDLIGAGRFLEIHVATPLIVCEQRDPKGLYRKARTGEIKEFTGISHPYEVPLTPHLALDTSGIALAECVNQLTALLDLEFA